MSTSMRTTGETAFRDTLKNGGCLAALLNELARNQTQQTQDIFAGAVSDLLATYVAVRSAGLAPQSADSEIDAFLQSPASVMAAQLTQKLSKADHSPWANSCLSAMVSAVSTHRDKITWPAPTAVAPAAPEPIAVRVVGMPDRVTETAVTYDTKTGDIKSTTQTERDAADPKA